MLHDNYTMGQDLETIDVWPPVLWEEFRPNTDGEILDHYYAHSAGCQKPTLWGGLATATAGIAAAAFLPATLAGSKAALLAIKKKGAASITKGIGKPAAALITKNVSDSLNANSKKAANTSKQKIRRQLDSGSEKDRIKDTYRREYQQLIGNNFTGRIGRMSLPELQNELKNQKRILKVSADKCKKLPCDSAGCRNMGVLTARMQYVEALIAAYKGSGTKTPAEYDAKFSDKAFKGETNMAGFGLGGMVPLLIIGGLLLSRLKK
jgi:hypothetical protein